MDLFFPSLFDKPAGIGFIEQEPNEHIELFLRQHAIVNLGWIVASIVAFFVPVLLLQIDLRTGTNFFLKIPLQFDIALAVLWYLLLIAYILENFLFWYFNIYIVTNVHLVDVDFYSLMYRKVTEIELKDIENVSSTVKGFFGPLFNFGDVIVETAGNHQDIEFLRVPRPDFVADRIEDLRAAVGAGGTE
jgi:uncharacterized membrane protein YdbT with pleckstrin-like domain